MKHTEPRFRLAARLSAIRGRRKGVKFMTGLDVHSSLVLAEKKSLTDYPRTRSTEVKE